MGVATLSVPFCTLRGLDIWKQRGGESRCMGIQKSLHMHASQTYELAMAGGEIILKGCSKQWIWSTGGEANHGLYNLSLGAANTPMLCSPGWLRFFFFFLESKHREPQRSLVLQSHPSSTLELMRLKKPANGSCKYQRRIPRKTRLNRGSPGYNMGRQQDWGFPASSHHRAITRWAQ